MTVRYQIDGDIFREITTHWLCASIKELLIKARKTGTDQAGNVVEYFQLSDGRIFTRPISSPLVVSAPKDLSARLRDMQPVIHEHSLTHS